MKAQLRSLLLLFLAAISQPLAAQSLIFYQKDNSEAYLVKLNGGGLSQANTDHFIEKLAAGNNKSPNRTEYILTADEHVRMTKVNANQYDVNVSLGNFRLSGDINYRGISMEAFLKPVGVKFVLERLNKAGQVVQRFPFDQVNLNANPTEIANFRGTDSSGLFIESSIRIAEKQFIYDKISRGNFDQQTIYIDDCYSNVPKLEVLYNDFKKVNPDDFEHIDAQQRELDALQARLNNIGSVNYDMLLGLSQNDPAGYLPRFRECQAIALQLSNQMDKTRNEIPERTYQRGLQFLAQNKLVEANNDFLTAVRLRPSLAPAHLELAKLRYREGDPIAAKERLKQLFALSQPDEQSRLAALDLANTLQLNYLGNADYAIKQKQYPKALQELSVARQFCSELPAPCQPDLARLSGLAHNGIYQGMIDTAKLALRDQQFEKAEAKAQEAMAYQRANATFIPLADHAVAVERDAQVRIYQRIVAGANTLAGQGKLLEAEGSARQAIAYQSGHSIHIPDPALAKESLLRIKVQQHKAVIAEAQSAQKLGDHGKALPLLDSAFAIEQQYAVERNANLDAMRKLSAKPIALALVPEGEKLASQNQLEAARQLNQNFNAMLETYGLAEDADLMAGQERLRNAIFSQECTNAQAEMDGHLRMADAEERAKRFIESVAALDKALAVASVNAQCGLNTQSAVEGKSRIAQAAQFQNLLLQSQQSIDKADYQVAIEQFEAAGQIFEQAQLGPKFGLQHGALLAYIEGSGRNAFIRFGCEYMTMRGQLDEALQLMHKCVAVGISKGMLKNLMVKLGTELANRDADQGLQGDWKARAMSLTKGDKRLKKLYSAYLKQRKRVGR